MNLEILALISIIVGEVIIILFGCRHIPSKLWVFISFVFFLRCILDITLDPMSRILHLIIGFLGLLCAKFGPEEY